MRILCFGDSNTYGYDPRSCFADRYPAQERWVDILAAETGWECINAGQNGRELPRYPGELEQTVAMLKRYAPEVFMVMLGTNDLLQGCSAVQTRARMEAFLRQTRPWCREILLIAPPPMKRGACVPEETLITASAQLAEEYEALAGALGIWFADAGKWNVELTFDGVHFSAAGHRAFAAGVQRCVEGKTLKKNTGG